MDWEDLLVESLSNRTKIRIMRYLLGRKGANISRIARELGVSYESAKRNLRALNEIGVLEEITIGRARIYRLSDNEAVRRLIACITGGAKL
ncbi:MAG: winged helix-turn-helix domain-containing protein [Candidatus Korarchaeum sp.]|nr:winged helix-turn-helix domain-containing protein [Candidatus Korarchaeum sp.]MDW8034831.1 winged helix-turn-helix domain-containing protein [Candidatus Korarchaeum sp.]